MIQAFVLATVVTTHFYVPNDDTHAKVYAAAPDTTELCSLPCTLELDQGAHVRVAFEGELDSAREITIEGEPGKTTQAEVTRGGGALYVTGIVLVGAGAAAVGYGMVGMISDANGQGSLASPALALFLAGIAVGGGGLALILTRTSKPSVDQRVTRQSAAPLLLPKTSTLFSLAVSF